jgi:hypothetical protein
MNTHTLRRPVLTSRRILGWSAAGIAGLSAVWVLSLAALDAADAPWGFLAIFVTPYLIGLAVLRRLPRVAAVIIGLFHLVFATACAISIARDPFDMPGWAGYLLVYIGTPLSVAGLVAAVRVLFNRP